MVHVDRLETIPLDAGRRGTWQTLRAMAEMVRRGSRDPRVRDAALAITRGCPGHDFQCEIRRLFEFVRDRIVFRRDPIGQERVQDAPRTLFIFRSGDCDDQSVLLAALLGSLGHQSRFVVLSFDGGDFHHVCLQVLDRGRWISLDPTRERAPIGWESPAVRRAIYPIFTGDQNPRDDRAARAALIIISTGALLWIAHGLLQQNRQPLVLDR